MGSQLENNPEWIDTQADGKALGADSGIRLFVASPHDCDFPEGTYFETVRIGAAGNLGANDRSSHFAPGSQADKMVAAYGSLATQYWAWKEVDAEYYGFFDDGFYLNLSPAIFDEDADGQVSSAFLDKHAIAQFGLDDVTIANSLAGCDAIIPKAQDLTRSGQSFESVFDRYESCPSLNSDDMVRILDIAKDRHPEYAGEIEEYLVGTTIYPSSAFIMSRAMFYDYCAWLFPLLKEFEITWDKRHCSMEALLTPKHLGACLFSIYIMHARQDARYQGIKELQLVHVENPEPQKTLDPAFPAANAIPIVLAADDNYSGPLSVALYSLISHFSTTRLYDIVILHRNISSRNQAKLLTLASSHDNVSLRFLDIRRIVSGYKLEANFHISTETYYRFLIQDVLPSYDKVLYLDSDMIICDDVAKLFDIDLEGNLLAAVPDPDYTGILNRDRTRGEYSTEKLHLKNPYDYFQAGVLLFNEAEMRRLHSLREWLDLTVDEYLFNDQDILNMECQGRVHYLDYAWNMMVDTGRYEFAIIHAPADACEAYLESRKDPKIIHYAGCGKPWNRRSIDFGWAFWEYARHTPYYEELLYNMFEVTIFNADYYKSLAREAFDANHYRDIAAAAMNDDFFHALTRSSLDMDYLLDQSYIYTMHKSGSRSFPQKVIDAALPYGTPRRDFIKHIANREEISNGE